MSQDFTIANLGALTTARHHALFLNNQSLLTRGPESLTRRALLAPLCSLTGVHTLVDDADGVMLQAQRFDRRSLAALIFLSPVSASPANATHLLEALLKQLGSYGIQGVTAELDENSAACETLQHAGLTVQAHQRIWKLSAPPAASQDNLPWQPYLSRHALGLRVLRTNTLPAPLQHLEYGPADVRDSYVYYRQGQLAAFADVQRGPQGIWVQLLADPAAPMADALTALAIALRPRHRRPVYISVRAHQDWLEPILEGLDARPGPRQVVLLRRMVQPVKMKDVQRIAQAAGIEVSTIRTPLQPTAPVDEK